MHTSFFCCLYWCFWICGFDITFRNEMGLYRFCNSLRIFNFFFFFFELYFIELRLISCHCSNFKLLFFRIFEGIIFRILMVFRFLDQECVDIK